MQHYEDVPTAVIEERLLKAPSEIAKLSAQTTEERTAFNKIEAEYENDLDKRYLELKAVNPEMTIKEIEASCRVEAHQKRLLLIEQEAVYESLKNKVQEQRDKFDAARSAIKLRVAELERFDS